MIEEDINENDVEAKNMEEFKEPLPKKSKTENNEEKKEDPEFNNFGSATLVRSTAFYLRLNFLHPLPSRC